MLYEQLKVQSLVVNGLLINRAGDEYAGNKITYVSGKYTKEKAWRSEYTSPELLTVLNTIKAGDEITLVLDDSSSFKNVINILKGYVDNPEGETVKAYKVGTAPASGGSTGGYKGKGSYTPRDPEAERVKQAQISFQNALRHSVSLLTHNKTGLQVSLEEVTALAKQIYFEITKAGDLPSGEVKRTVAKTATPVTQVATPPVAAVVKPVPVQSQDPDYTVEEV